MIYDNVALFMIDLKRQYGMMDKGLSKHYYTLFKNSQVITHLFQRHFKTFKKLKKSNFRYEPPARRNTILLLI